MGVLHPAEVVPVALGVRFVVRALLIPFAALAGYFVAWGLVFVMDAVVRAFFGTATGAVSWIPYAGKVLSTPLLAVEHKLTSFLGGLEQHFEHQMAARWHALAQLVEALAADTKAAAIFDYQLARKVATFWGNAATGHISGNLARIIHAVEAHLPSLTRTVVHVTKVVGTKADAVIVHRVGALAGELEHVIDWTIPRLRARERATEREIGRLWKREKARPFALGATAATALVAGALARLGCDWIRCNNARKLFKKRGCNAWTDIESLLAGAALLELPFTLELLATVGREVIKDGSELIKEFR